jgi:hypothetical protein
VIRPHPELARHPLGEADEGEIPDPGKGAEFFGEIGDRTTAFVDENPEAIRYVAGSIVEGEESALRLFVRGPHPRAWQLRVRVVVRVGAAAKSKLARASG